MTAGVGLLGGSFDPPHGAHVAMARAARGALGLGRVLLVPALQPPHKRPSGLSPYPDRLAMTALSVEAVDGVEASRLEEEGGPVSYTVELLERCRERFGEDLYFVVGADSLRDLPTWRSPEGILRMCTLVVFPRDDLPMVCEVPGEASIVVFEEPAIDVTSTDIRARVATGEDIRGLVEPGVAEYIRQHGLYE